MIGQVLAGALLLAGLVGAAFIGRRSPAFWHPGALGGLTGACGGGAARLAGWGDASLIALMFVLAVYGAVLGTVAWYFGRQ